MDTNGSSEFGGAGVDGRALVLVEGTSDRVALETLARRLGRDLAAEGIAVMAIGGAHALGRVLTQFLPLDDNARLAGLYDEGEERVVRRSLERAGFCADGQLTREDLERLGFYACVADLEDELIRALGTDAVQAVLASQGDLDSFRTLQKQPAWREQSVDAQLRRFMGSGSFRKIRYARLLVEALPLDRAPRPLRGVLSHL